MRAGAAALGKAAAAVLAMPSGAVAASSDGAQMFEEHVCAFDDSIGYLCRDAWAVTHTTMTPSGNIVVTGVFKGGFTLTDPVLGAQAQSQEYRGIHHELSRPDGATSFDLSLITFSGPTSYCDYRFMVHYADGRLIFDTSTVVCGPVQN